MWSLLCKTLDTYEAVSAGIGGKQMKTCWGCEKSCGHRYTSEPPMCKCTVTGKYHFSSDACDVEETVKQKKDKPLSEWTLGEAQRYCKEVRKCVCDAPDRCRFYLENENAWGSFCALCCTPSELDLPENPCLTPDELTICKMLGAKWVSRDTVEDGVSLWEHKPSCVDTFLDEGKIYYGDSDNWICKISANLFPSVRPGDCIYVEEATKDGI